MIGTRLAMAMVTKAIAAILRYCGMSFSPMMAPLTVETIFRKKKQATRPVYVGFPGFYYP